MTATLAKISSVKRVIQTLTNFEKCSGLKMNLSKTKAMWIGTSKNSLVTSLGLEWCTGAKTSISPVTKNKLQNKTSTECFKKVTVTYIHTIY